MNKGTVCLLGNISQQFHIDATQHLIPTVKRFLKSSLVAKYAICSFTLCLSKVMHLAKDKLCLAEQRNSVCVVYYNISTVW